MAVISVAGGSTLCCTPNSRRAAAATIHVSGESTGAFGSLEANGDNNAATAAGTAASPLAGTSSTGSGAADMLSGAAGSFAATTSFVADAAGCLAVPITVAGAALPVGATAGRRSAPGVRSECVGLTACPRRTSVRSLPEAMSMPIDGSTVGVTSTTAWPPSATASAIGVGVTSEVCAPPELDTTTARRGRPRVLVCDGDEECPSACAPPELDTIRGATLRLLRDGGDESVSAADAGASGVAAGDPVCGSDDFDAADPESGLDDEPDSVGSAKAMPAPLVSAAPTPSATANAPTRPMYVA